MKYAIALTGLLFCLLSGAAESCAQHKIGYVNAELVINLMPETKQAEQQLMTFQRNLGEKAKVERSYYEGLVTEYQSMKQAGTMTPENEQAKIKEIQDMEQKIQKFADQSQTSLMNKERELMNPILDKLQNVIDETAEANGYDYVFNSNIGGTSALLKGPKGDNLTLKVLDKLGVEVPDEVRAQLDENAVPAKLPGESAPTAPGE